MSYDIYLKDPVSEETIEIDEPHFMRGGTYKLGGNTELWLNITYNYGCYYREASKGDLRFGEDGGIRGIYGKTGAESVPMLEDLISRIENRYKKDGEWIVTKRDRFRYFDSIGKEIDYGDALGKLLRGEKVYEKEYSIEISEGPNDDYWEDTAGNAIRPLYQLIAFAKMRPDGIWDGD